MTERSACVPDVKRSRTRKQQNLTRIQSQFFSYYLLLPLFAFTKDKNVPVCKIHKNPKPRSMSPVKQVPHLRSRMRPRNRSFFCLLFPLAVFFINIKSPPRCARRPQPPEVRGRDTVTRHARVKGRSTTYFLHCHQLRHISLG